MSDQQKQILTKVVAHNGKLVVMHQTQTSVDGLIVTPYDKPGNLGYVIMDIGHIAVSEEAHSLMNTVSRGRDAIGDIDIFQWSPPGETPMSRWAFSTFGMQERIIDPKEDVTARGYRVPDISLFQVIPNEITEDKFNEIAAAMGR